MLENKVVNAKRCPEVVFLLLLLLICAGLCKCTFHAGVDWVGETKKDNRSYSGEKKQ